MLHHVDRAKAERSNLIAGLPQEVRQTLLDQAAVRTFERGTTIFLQGEPARVIYVVLDGWVKLYRIAQSGNEVVLSCFTTGQSFAEPVVLRKDNYPINAEAVTDCRVVTIQGSLLTDLISRRPEVTTSIIASMYAHFQDLVLQIESLKAKSGAQRVANFLLDLCGEQNCGSATVMLPFDKSLIAGSLGMKPESLSRAFSRLNSVGVTIHQKTAEIADIDRVRAYTEEDPADAWNRTA